MGINAEYMGERREGPPPPTTPPNSPTMTPKKVAKKTTAKKGPKGAKGGRKKKGTESYLVFCERHRKTVMRKNPELRSKQVTTELARLWQAVEPRGRSICQEVAQKDSQRHEREMEEYRKRQED